jgi:hypothetical protein
VWFPLGERAADGNGVIFEIPAEPGAVFFRLRME